MPGEKAAIVETSRGLRALYCTESTQVWFFDIMKVFVEGQSQTLSMDEVFLETVHVETLCVVSVTPGLAVKCGATIVDGVLSMSVEKPCEVVVMIAGIRKGYADVRMASKSQEQYTRSRDFWGWLASAKEDFPT